MPRSRHVLPRLLATAALALVVVACAGSGTPVASFDPAGPCTSDGQRPGAYPELEALLPTAYEGTAPTRVDSGRSCTSEALGSLGDAGITELRFAGATWETGGSAGWTLASFTADGLTPRIMRDFYEVGARAARRAEKVVGSDTTVAGLPAWRLDVLMSDGTGQTVVAWQAADDGPVWVLLAADVGDTRFAELLEAFGSR
jgi:hypothetical protein